MHIQNHVAVVSGKSVAQHRVATQFHQLPCHEGTRHGDHFHRQGKLAEHVHQLAPVDDAHEFLGAGCDDFFAGERATTTLDHGHVAGNFIGTVHIDFHLTHFVEIDHANAVFLQALCRGDAGSDGPIDFSLDVSQCVNEKVGGGTGAHADDACGNMIDGGTRRGLFHFVLRHHDAILFVVYG